MTRTANVPFHNVILRNLCFVCRTFLMFLLLLLMLNFSSSTYIDLGCVVVHCKFKSWGDDDAHGVSTRPVIID